MGFDPDNGGSQKRACGLSIGMIGKAVKEGADIPFGQRRVTPRLMEFDETNQGQITGIRARKGIQDLAERVVVHPVQDETSNVVPEIPSCVFICLFSMSQGGVNRPQGFTVRFVREAQSIQGLGASRLVRRQIQDPGQDGNGTAGLLQFGIQGAQLQSGLVGQPRARIFFQELFEGDDGLAVLPLSLQGRGVQKGELLDEGGRLGLIEKPFDQSQRRVTVFLSEFGPDAGEGLLLGQRHLGQFIG